MAEKKLVRAKLDSTQLRQYFLGLDEIETLERDYRKKVGAAFNQRTFNEALIGHGSVAVKFLRRVSARRQVMRLLTAHKILVAARARAGDDGVGRSARLSPTASPARVRARARDRDVAARRPVPAKAVPQSAPPLITRSSGAPSEAYVLARAVTAAEPAPFRAPGVRHAGRA